jgi:O-antigen ligase
MFTQIGILLALFGCDIGRLKRKESALFFLFVCLMALHVPFATNNYLAYWTTRTMALQFVVFLGIVGFVDTHERLRLVLSCWIIIAVLCSVRGALEGGSISGSGFLGDENDFSLFLNMMIPVAFFLGRSSSARRVRLFFYSGVGILIAGTISSFSRGGFVGLVPPLLYCWYKSPRRISTAIVCALISLFLAVYVIPESYWQEMKTIVEEGADRGTGGHRVYMWKCAWNMFLDHPLVGVGPGNYPVNLGEYEPPGGYYRGRSEVGRAVHSVYFTLLPELGLVGALLFFSMIWVNLREISLLTRTSAIQCVLDIRENREITRTLDAAQFLGWGLTGAMIAYFISGAFLSVLYYGHFWLIMGFSVARNNIVKSLIQDSQAEPVTMPTSGILMASVPPRRVTL